MQEKRAYTRKSIDVEVSCQREADGAFSGKSKDISIGGMFIFSEQVPSFGDKLLLKITLPGAAGELSLPAVVRWADRGSGGFGVQFGLLGARETHAIAKLMRRS